MRNLRYSVRRENPTLDGVFRPGWTPRTELNRTPSTCSVYVLSLRRRYFAAFRKRSLLVLFLVVHLPSMHHHYVRLGVNMNTETLLNFSDRVIVLCRHERASATLLSTWSQKNKFISQSKGTWGKKTHQPANQTKPWERKTHHLANQTGYRAKGPARQGVRRNLEPEKPTS